MIDQKFSDLSIEFQDRDLALLRGLFECRTMTSAHVSSLYFDGKEEAAKKRLQKLKSAGFIGERRRKAYERSLLFLTGKAFSVLRDQGILADYPPLEREALEKRARVSELTLRHELEVMDVKAAFHSALEKRRGFRIVEFTTWPALCQFESARPGFGKEILVKPDSFIRIHETEKDGGLSEHTFFLEVDRSSEVQDILVGRAGCYFHYYKSGGFARRNGAPPSEYEDYPFRVLIVCKTAERRNNTAEHLLQSNPPIFSFVCLSTFAEVTENPFGDIWINTFEYRKITKGTAFDPERKREAWGYKRQTERELFVEANVKKFSILG